MWSPSSTSQSWRATPFRRQSPRWTDSRVSEILITEFAAVASRKHAEKSITTAQQTRVLREFSGHVDAGYWCLLPCTRDELAAAADLIRRCQSKARVRTMDAVHLSTCLTHRLFPLFTADRVMLQAARYLGIPTQTV